MRNERTRYVDSFNRWIHSVLLAGGSCTSVAQRIGVHPSQLSHLRSGRRLPAPDVRQRIEKASGGLVPAEFLRCDHCGQSIVGMV